MRAVSLRLRVWVCGGWVARGGWVSDAVKPGIHCARTHWIRGFMTFHRERGGRGARADAGELGVARTGLCGRKVGFGGWA